MLEERLAERPFLLADGATGTNLFEMGLVSGEAPELWLKAHPDRIMALHQSFVDAGADIILTNSFGCNARRLMLHGLQSRARELNREAARLAREVAAKAPRPIVVAGSVGPTGDLLAPLGSPHRGRGRGSFRRADRGVDGGRRSSRLDRDHVGSRRDACRRRGRRKARHALHLDRELRHGRAHDDGACAFGPRLRSPRASSRRPRRSVRIAVSAPQTSSCRFSISPQAVRLR